MARFKLLPYVFAIRNRGQGGRLQLDGLRGGGLDALDVISDFLETLEDVRFIDERDKALLLDGDAVRQGRTLFGILKGGEHGVMADFANRVTGEVEENARTMQDAEVYPFFFLVHVPEGLDNGIMIFQKFGVYGIKTDFDLLLNQFLENLGFIAGIRRMIGRELIERLDRSRLMEVRLIRHEVPADVAVRVHGGDADEVKEERVFKVRRSEGIELAQRFRRLLGNRDIAFYEVGGERYDEVKAVIDENGTKVTLSFGDENRMFEYLPIDEEEIPLEGGFPTLGHLSTVGLDYLETLIGRLERD